MTIGISHRGQRCRPLERLDDRLQDFQPTEQSLFTPDRRAELARSAVPEMIRRELIHAGALSEDASFPARILAHAVAA